MPLPAGDGAITIVQSGGESDAAAASAARAFSSDVTSGNKIVILVARFSGGANDPFIAGDCTKIDGTAIIGTVELVVEENFETQPASGNYVTIGIWAADVTGTGTLTMSVAGNAGNDWGIACVEINSNSGWNAGYIEDTIFNATATDDTSASSGDATSAGKAIFLGVVGFESGDMTITADGAFTLIFEQEQGSLHMACSMIYKIVSSGNTDSFDWTATVNSGWVTAGSVIKGA
jgi:hypothetical protein